MSKKLWALLRAGFEAASAAQLLSAAGVSTIASAVLAGVTSLPWPFRFLVFVGSALVLIAIFLVALAAYRARKAADPHREAPVPSGQHRVGIDNRGGKSISKRATFGSGLDTAIDNREGGESQDEDSTFL